MINTSSTLGEYRKSINEADTSLINTNNKITQLETSLANAQNNINNLQTALVNAQNTISSLQTSLTNALNEITNLKTQINTLNNSVFKRVFITSVTDMNTLTTSGVYTIQIASCTNTPTSHWGTVFVDFEVGTPYQIYIADGGTLEMYKRGYTTSTATWGAWAAL
jgi:uncharacterized coiled-coil protein SlyX